MRPGRLDQQVALLRRELGTSASGSGLGVEEFVRVTTVWAEVKPLRGGESTVAGGDRAVTTYQFRIRYRDALDETWRLEWRGQQYDIREVLPGGQRLREYLEIQATATDQENPVF